MVSLTTLGELFSAWLAEGQRPGATNLTRTAARHTAAAYGVAGPSDVPLSPCAEMPARLRQYLKAREKRVRPQSMANYLHALRQLLAWGRKRGLIEPTPVDVDLEAAWPKYDPVPQRQNRVEHWKVSGYLRFRRWAVAQGLRPADLRPRHFDEWRKADLAPGRRHWRAVYGYFARFWREAAGRGELPAVAIPPLPNRNPEPYTLALADWPERLRKEYQAYRDWATGALVVERPARARQEPRTADQRLQILQSYVGFLRRNLDLDLASVGFADLFRKDWVTAYLAWRIETSRRRRPNQAHIGIITFFTGIIRNCLRTPFAEYQWLRDLRQQVSRQVHVGPPSELPTYDDLERVADGVRDERGAALKGYRKVTASNKRWQATMMRNELILRFLLSRPLRNGNLRDLRWGRSLLQRDGQWWIDIPAEAVKNREPLLLGFPPELVPLLEEYREKYWPMLAGNSGSDLVFPTREGGPIDEKNLLDMIRGACRRHIGKRMTVQWFRHAVAMAILKDEPGAYPLVSALLGHKGIKTALAHYGRLDAAGAARRVDQWRMSRKQAHPDVSPLTGDRALVSRLHEAKRRPAGGRS